MKLIMSKKQTDLFYALRESAVTLKDYSDMRINDDPKLAKLATDMIRKFDAFWQEVE